MMGYIKQIVVLILTAGSLSFVPLNRIIIWIFHKNSGCLFQKINTKEGQVRTVGDLYIKFDKPLEKELS
jgi:hypothetical protein